MLTKVTLTSIYNAFLIFSHASFFVSLSSITWAWAKSCTRSRVSIHPEAFRPMLIKGDRQNEIEPDTVYIAMQIIERNVQLDWTRESNQIERFFRSRASLYKKHAARFYSD